MPLPVCKRVRARHNKKVQGRIYCGFCAAKKEKFYGFRLHLIVDLEGIPVAVEIMPGAYHDLDSLYELFIKSACANSAAPQKPSKGNLRSKLCCFAG